MRKLTYVLVGTTGLFLFLNLSLRITGVVVWDDAYFFVRYADNLLENGSWSWNPGASSTYGLTSLAYGVQVCTLRIFDVAPALTLWLGSFVWGGISLLLIGKLMFTCTGSKGEIQHFIGFLAIVTLAFQIPQLAQHFTSGMDTMMGVAWISGYLLLFKYWESSLSLGKVFVLGLLGGLTWLVRPELTLFTVGLPLGVALWSETKLVKLKGLSILLFTGSVLTSCIFLTKNYFGKIFPLAFWVKSAGSYGPEITLKYRLEGLEHLGIFAACNWIPFGVIIGTIVAGKKYWWQNLSPGDRMLFVGVFLFLIYESIFVLQIMGYNQRFYFPVWPVLMYLVGRFLTILLEKHSRRLSIGTFRIQWRDTMGPIVLVALAISLSTWLQRPRNLRRDWGKFANEDVYTGIGKHNWPLLPSWAIFPNNFKLGGTELGIPGVMHPEKIVVDFTGLHDPKMLGKFSVEHLLEQAPDLIYMPHPDYVGMHQVLNRSTEFQNAYHVYEPEVLQSYLGIALRRKSQYYYKMKGIVDDHLLFLDTEGLQPNENGVL